MRKSEIKYLTMTCGVLNIAFEKFHTWSVFPCAPLKANSQPELKGRTQTFVNSAKVNAIVEQTNPSTREADIPLHLYTFTIFIEAAEQTKFFLAVFLRYDLTTPRGEFDAIIHDSVTVAYDGEATQHLPRVSSCLCLVIIIIILLKNLTWGKA